MKKLILSLILVTGLFSAIKAQTEVFNAVKHTEIKKDTTVNVDTSILTFNSMGSRLKAIDLVVSKISGTVSGTVYIQASNTGGLTWDSIDSLVTSNQVTNKKHKEFTATTYKSYRVYYITSGTQSSILYAGYLRRPDE